MLLAVAARSHAQGRGSAPPEDGGPPGNVIITLHSEPGVSLPVGTEVTLTESHVPDLLSNEQYQWNLCPCVGASPPKPCEKVENWTTKTISFCSPAADKNNFLFELTHSSTDYVSPARKGIDITWHPPDRMKFQYLPTQKIFTPAVPAIPEGQPNGPQDYQPTQVMFINPLNVTLYYGGTPIGACAQAYGREMRKCRVLHRCALGLPDDSQTRPMPENPNGRRIFPKICDGYHDEKSIRGDGVPIIPGLPETTWNWRSPTLTDSHVIGWRLLDPNRDLTAIPDGTPIYHIERQYISTGPQCHPRLQPTTGGYVNFWILKSDFQNWYLVVRSINGIKKVVLEGPSEWNPPNGT